MVLKAPEMSKNMDLTQLNLDTANVSLLLQVCEAYQEDEASSTLVGMQTRCRKSVSRVLKWAEVGNVI